MSTIQEKTYTVPESQLKEIKDAVNRLEGVVSHSSGTSLSEKIESLEELEGIADDVKSDIEFTLSNIRYNSKQGDKNEPSN